MGTHTLQPGHALLHVIGLADVERRAAVHQPVQPQHVDALTCPLWCTGLLEGLGSTAGTEAYWAVFAAAQVLDKRCGIFLAASGYGANDTRALFIATKIKWFVFQFWAGCAAMELGGGGGGAGYYLGPSRCWLQGCYHVPGSNVQCNF